MAQDTGANLYDFYQRAFPQDGESLLLTTNSGRTLSYAAAERTTAQLARCLQHMGAQPGDRVTVQVEKSVESLCLYLACLRAGLVYHPLNTAYQATELDYFLGNAKPTIVICDSQNEALMASLVPADIRQNVLTLDTDSSGTLMEQAAVCADTFSTVHRDGNDLAALLYSSGTTGRPKGIMLTHANLSASTAMLIKAWEFTSDDCLLHALPVFHVHGLFVALGCVLGSGASMRWLDRFNAEDAMAALPHCSVMMGVPTFYTRLLAEPSFPADSCANMRLFISGSAPLLIETFNEFQQRTGHTILERYGMTETSMNTSNPLHGERRAGTVGPALPGVDTRVVNEQGCELKAGETGNLQVRGPNVFPGYWHMPEKTAEDFTPDGFFNTGDKAVISEDGYVAIVGRAKDMIISGGLNIYPREIEMLLDDMEGVRESAIIGIPHPDFGEAVVAVIVGEAENAPDATAVIDYTRGQLANFKVPKHVHFVDELPRNAMGKVQKNLLRERYTR